MEGHATGDGNLRLCPGCNLPAVGAAYSSQVRGAGIKPGHHLQSLSKVGAADMREMPAKPARANQSVYVGRFVLLRGFS